MSFALPENCEANEEKGFSRGALSFGSFPLGAQRKVSDIKYHIKKSVFKYNEGLPQKTLLLTGTVVRTFIIVYELEAFKMYKYVL